LLALRDERDGAEQSVERREAHGLLRLREGRHELDLEVRALQLLRRGRHDAGHHDARERDVDERREHLVVQALEHRAEHEELLLVALRDLARRHRHAARVVREHQEEVGVEAPADATAHVLHVLEQVLQIEVDVEEVVPFEPLPAESAPRCVTPPGSDRPRGPSPNPAGRWAAAS
jgi:hypothetical protein